MNDYTLAFQLISIVTLLAMLVKVVIEYDELCSMKLNNYNTENTYVAPKILINQ